MLKAIEEAFASERKIKKKNNIGDYCFNGVGI
jgi:hypothetical protein